MGQAALLESLGIGVASRQCTSEVPTSGLWGARAHLRPGVAVLSSWQDLCRIVGSVISCPREIECSWCSLLLWPRNTLEFSFCRRLATTFAKGVQSGGSRTWSRSTMLRKSLPCLVVFSTRFERALQSPDSRLHRTKNSTEDVPVELGTIQSDGRKHYHASCGRRAPVTSVRPRSRHVIW